MREPANQLQAKWQARAVAGIATAPACVPDELQLFCRSSAIQALPATTAALHDSRGGVVGREVCARGALGELAASMSSFAVMLNPPPFICRAQHRSS